MTKSGLYMQNSLTIGLFNISFRSYFQIFNISSNIFDTLSSIHIMWKPIYNEKDKRNRLEAKVLLYDRILCAFTPLEIDCKLFSSVNMLPGLWLIS